MWRLSLEERKERRDLGPSGRVPQERWHKVLKAPSRVIVDRKKVFEGKAHKEREALEREESADLQTYEPYKQEEGPFFLSSPPPVHAWGLGTPDSSAHWDLHPVANPRNAGGQDSSSSPQTRR